MTDTNENYLYERVKTMYNKFNLNPEVFSHRDKTARITMMQEELNEYHEAVTDIDEADALVDLLIFTIGTMVMCDYPLNSIFNVVMHANESKHLGDKGRGTTRDLIKPKDWVGPEHEIRNILRGTNKEAPKMYEDKVIKDDAQKNRLELLPFDTLTGVADVFAYGADKYYKDSWRSATPATYSRSFGSILRHLTRWYAGQEFDPESNLNHIDHAISQLLIMRYSMINNPEADDRYVEDSE